MFKKNLSNYFLTVIVVSAFAVGYFGSTLKNEIYWEIISPILSVKNNYPLIFPKPTPIKKISPTEFPLRKMVFDLNNIVTIKRLGTRNELYYLKDGNIMLASNFNMAHPNENKKLVDTDETILSFQVDHLAKQIAYTVRRGPSENEEFINNYGNTIIVRNIQTGLEQIVYTKDSSELEIRSLMFSPDDTKLIFGSNTIGVIYIATKEVKKYLPLDTQAFCRVYFIDDISPNEQYVLVRLGCMEGGSQEVINIQTGEKIGTFDNGYGAGGQLAYGFINNETLLGYINPHSVTGRENTDYTISTFDIRGKLIREVFAEGRITNQPAAYWETRGGWFHITFPHVGLSAHNTDQDRKLSIYQISNFDPTQLYVMNLDNDNIIISIRKPTDDTATVWFTDTNLQTPSFERPVLENIKNGSKTLNLITR